MVMTFTRLALAAVLAAPCLFAAPAPARACTNTVWGSTSTVGGALRDAAVMVERGRHRQAVARIRDQFHGDTLEPPILPRGDQVLLAHGQTILALAVARSRGAVVLEPGLGGKRQDHRDAAINWAIARMRWLIAGSDELAHVVCERGECRTAADPGLDVILAELLALRTDGRAEALQLLSQLDRDDLMPTPAGWAVLAALYRQNGRTGDAARAAARCQQITGKDAGCRVAL
jgi:hypothetical protein